MAEKETSSDYLSRTIGEAKAAKRDLSQAEWAKYNDLINKERLREEAYSSALSNHKAAIAEYSQQEQHKIDQIRGKTDRNHETRVGGIAAGLQQVGHTGGVITAVGEIGIVAPLTGILRIKDKLRLAGREFAHRRRFPRTKRRVRKAQMAFERERLRPIRQSSRHALHGLRNG